MPSFQIGDDVYLPRIMFTGKVLGVFRDLEGVIFVVVQATERTADGKLPMMLGNQDAWRHYKATPILIP